MPLVHMRYEFRHDFDYNMAALRNPTGEIPLSAQSLDPAEQQQDYNNHQD